MDMCDLQRAVLSVYGQTGEIYKDRLKAEIRAAHRLRSYEKGTRLQSQTIYPDEAFITAHKPD